MFNHPLLHGLSKADRDNFAAELRKSLAGQNGLVDDAGNRIEKTVTGNTGVTTGLGLLGYPLEAPAKLLYPVTTPLRNKLPREVVGGASVTFRKVTGINTGVVWGSVAEATSSTTGRNSIGKFNEADVTVNFKSVERETLLTIEAQMGANSRITPGQDFQAEEFAVLSLLQDTMIAEERLDLGGNITALGNVAAPTKAATQPATGTGALTASTNYYFYVSALTEQGYAQSAQGKVAGVDAPGETGCPIGVEATLATTAGGNAGDTSITITWVPKAGAVAYNVYAGTATGVANAKYQATVYTNSYTQSALIAAGNLANALDQTANALDYDGLIPLCYAGGYTKALSYGATFTGDATTGVSEFDDAFAYFYNTYKVSPSEILVNSAQKKKVDSICIGSAAPIVRIEAQAGDLNFTGTIGVKSVMNRYMNTEVPVTVHPFLPPGTALFVTYNLGPYYPNARIANNLTKMLSWDYRKIDFAMAKRAREMGIDFRGALVNYAPFALGVISNIS